MAERAPDLDPFEEAIAFAIREAARRRAADETARRRTMTVIDGGKRKGPAA